MSAYTPAIFLAQSFAFSKLDEVALLVADPPDANSTTDNDTHPLSDIGT